MLGREGVADQHHARPAVGHLAAVEAADAALDGRVDLVVVAHGGQVGRNPPLARLGVGLRRALARFTAAMARRCASSMPKRRSYSSATWLNM